MVRQQLNCSRDVRKTTTDQFGLTAEISGTTDTPPASTDSQGHQIGFKAGLFGKTIVDREKIHAFPTATL